MAAFKLISDVAVQFKLGSCATKLINNQFKLSGLTIWPPSLNQLLINLVERCPRMNWMAKSNIDLDAAIQSVKISQIGMMEQRIRVQDIHHAGMPNPSLLKPHFWQKLDHCEHESLQ
jgi:hypothetical protein